VAAAGAGQVLPLFVLDDALTDPAGGPRLAFLFDCLRHLDESIGDHLVIRHGPPEAEVAKVAASVGAGAVYAAADFGVYGRRRDEAVSRSLDGVAFEPVGSPYAVEPGTVANPDGEPYRVFTPFFRAWAGKGPLGAAGNVSGTKPLAATGPIGTGPTWTGPPTFPPTSSAPVCTNHGSCRRCP
jgi:deoxyribodipyrimidine photo-lyase